MPLWMLIALLALIKLPIAALMLWIPFRNDAATNAPEPPGQSDDDGGTRTMPGGPLDPRPRRPLPSGPRPRCAASRPARHAAPPAPPRAFARPPARRRARVRVSH